MTMNKEKIISCAVSVSVAAVMAATALGVSAIAGRGDAYIEAGADRTDSDLAGSESESDITGIDTGTDAASHESTNLPEDTSFEPPVITSDGAESETDSMADTDAAETAGTPETTGITPEETKRGPEKALGGLRWDEPPETTTFETSIVVLPDTTDTDMTDTETEPTPPETEPAHPETTRPETTRPETTPPEIDPPQQTEPSVTDPEPPETYPELPDDEVDETLIPDVV